MRLVRLGRRHRAYFRVRVADDRFAPTGRFLEELGHVDPFEKDASKRETLNRERIEHWLGLGATVSDSVASILKRNGISRPQAAKTTAAS
ncbi:MAG: 30S ribosomal protein S16 [Phycisphaerales bacterium]|nr:30S ribosomal protein S16 [Phycisphaerales bacterium]MCB9854052.1 30S ribosomal protein S16 [Phycisphaerales bacterium]MCB9864362.1 30S ribosomal protein S16 [Phycisphaerales bacterium]